MSIVCYNFIKKWKKNLFVIVLVIFPLQNVMADNCSSLNFYRDSSGSGDSSDGWMGYGDVFNGGALFIPSFTAGLAAKYVASSGQTASYSLPSSIGVMSNDTASYYTALIGLGSWNNHYWDLGSSGFIYVGKTPGGYQKANKSGQNCSATIRISPVKGTTVQNIGGISVTVSENGGNEVTARGYASTTTPMTTLQPSGVRMNMNLNGAQLNLSTAGTVLITVPANTPDGDYTGTIKIPYSVNACAGEYTCNDTRIWQHARLGTSNINASIKIRVVGGKPENPDTYCTVTSGAGLDINHGLLSPNSVNGNRKSNSIIVSCTGGTTVPVKVKLSPVGNPHTGSQLTGNNGVLTPLGNNIDSLVSLGDDRVTAKTINVSSLANLPVNSELKTVGNVQAGEFSGSVIVSVTYK
ncbi:hypothetical protein EHB58_23960 [Salmonella enterica subsp. enterica serovar Hull]|uniref:Fimbrial adhesin MrpH C-terminal domain-containing protein n=1 Tax=Salmonella enterica subsp. enterica serovar Hull TaxID=1403564 RepID=A0A5X4PM04_SALET|nr:hypothetical protein [Salmonella enterica subsp. enterica serovar Putten]EBZ7588763.1 hypothetical protein [Salmonella enterica subsp. enterica serovar Hull]EBZ8651189.1 hypothetical protein [Salmonella enterica subsp. enterica serovar Hull]EEB7450861.1 hypothetical protein [Salmonella enterica subsp. enterica serovar Emek]